MTAAPLKLETPAARTAQNADDCRCLCGNLLAKFTPHRVELKCRRCKRTLLVPVPLAAGAPINASLSVYSIPGSDPG